MARPLRLEFAHGLYHVTSLDAGRLMGDPIDLLLILGTKVNCSVTRTNAGLWRANLYVNRTLLMLMMHNIEKLANHGYAR